MKIFTSIRVRLARYFLGKMTSQLQRKRVAISLEHAREIGIIYSLVSEEEYSIVSGFAKSLQEKGKKVQVLGYYKGKSAPVYYAPKLAYDLLLTGDIDLLLRPVSEFSNKFVDYPFDILIDLSSSSDFPLSYIVELSKAGFKVGEGKAGISEPYDLLIKSTSPLPLKTLIEQIVHYTSTIDFITPPIQVVNTEL